MNGKPPSFKKRAPKNLAHDQAADKGGFAGGRARAKEADKAKAPMDKTQSRTSAGSKFETAGMSRAQRRQEELSPKRLPKGPKGPLRRSPALVKPAKVKPVPIIELEVAPDVPPEVITAPAPTLTLPTKSTGANIDPDNRAGERIAKVMARAGVASRRDIERMIAEGRISVNDALLTSPAFLVLPEDKIYIDGVEMGAPEVTRLWLYHKPVGLVTTHKDPEGRPNLFDTLKDDLPRVVSVGRLDINSEGLLLLTNDGGLARALELPANGLKRTYRARALGRVDQDSLDKLAEGCVVEGVEYGPIIANLERADGANCWIEVTLSEGRNREVRKVLGSLDLKVNRLIRVRYGPFALMDLKSGATHEVPYADMKRALRDLVPPSPKGAVAVKIKVEPEPPPQPKKVKKLTGGRVSKTGRSNRNLDTLAEEDLLAKSRAKIQAKNLAKSRDQGRATGRASDRTGAKTSAHPNGARALRPGQKSRKPSTSPIRPKK